MGKRIKVKQLPIDSKIRHSEDYKLGYHKGFEAGWLEGREEFLDSEVKKQQLKINQKTFICDRCHESITNQS